MGLLTAIRHRRSRYSVTVTGLGADFPVEEFRTLWEARECADYLAWSNGGVVCFIHRQSDDEIVHRSQRAPDPRNPRSDDPPHDDGSLGVREPRRPVPGPSSGSIALDLPD
jgi:hypothetical protein